MKETVSQKWQHNREMRQIEFETCLSDIQASIEKHNDELAELFATTEDGAPESLAAISDYINASIEKLDKMWPFFKSDIFVGGKWHKGELSGESSLDNCFLRIVNTQEDVFKPAVSLGFGAHRDEDSRRCAFGLVFASEPATSRRLGSTAWGTLEYTFQPYAFAEPHEVTLQYIGTADQDTDRVADVDEIHATLKAADAMHSLYTKHPKTGFYQLSAQRQAKYLDSFVTPIYDTLPAPESRTDLMVYATVDTLYTSNGVGDLTIREAEAHKPLEIYGEVIGFTVLDVIVAANGIHKLHSASELIDPEAGICVAVLEPNNSPDSVVYVPSRNASQLDFSLHTT